MTQRQDQLLERLREATLALRRTLDERDALEREKYEPIAIVGIGCRFPGGASSPSAFWDLLLEGRDAVGPLADRWALVGVSPEGDVPRWAGLLTEAVDAFDAAFFGISPREAVSLDPQHRLLLEVGWEALEDAGILAGTLEGSRTGVFVGALTTDYARLVEQRPRTEQDAYGMTGNLLSVAAGRLSYTLGLQGPCMTVDTACSSSLVSVHLACRSLRAGECDLALAGGVNLMLSADVMEGTSRTQALSPDGRCKTFDALANGFARGEGCGLLVLKRLSDAQRDGDPIRALIRGSAINQDGRSTGMTAPNVLAQEALLHEALENARVTSDQIGFVETHGTGTSLGDPIEVEALRAVLGAARPDGSRCLLGAVKTNVGHLEAAAGVAGLIKAALALQHEAIPGNLHLRQLNPRISLEGTPFVLPTETVTWPRQERRRLAGVSSFGISGTNAHVVLEEAPAQNTPDRTGSSPPDEPTAAALVVVSARNEQALADAAGRLGEHLQAHPELELPDVAFSLARTRTEMPHRLAIAATSREGLLEALATASRGETPAGGARGRVELRRRPEVIFVFPGQGSQWAGMGRQLLAEEPVFREALEASDRAVRAEAGWSLLQTLEGSPDALPLERIDVVQPVLFAIEVALSALWRSWGVEPDGVVGHSMGEVAAAHVAGVLSLADAVAVICCRSQLLRRLSGQGEMALVELSFEAAEAALAGYEDRLSVAVSNSPRATVLSGDPEALGQVMARLEGQGVFCRRVKVDVASHSPQVDPLEEELTRGLRDLRPQPARMRMQSTVTALPVEGPELGASYWVTNLRQPVRFAQTVEALLDGRHRLFVEMSPHPLLVTAIEEMRHAKGDPGGALASLWRERAERSALLESLGALWAQGQAVSWDRVLRDGGLRVTLPTYPWQRQRYWVDLSAHRKTGHRGHAGEHPLLGEGLSVSASAGMHLWETTLDHDRLPWLQDHRVQGLLVFPGAGYLEMALSAGRSLWGEHPLAVTDVALIEALTPADDEPTTVQMVTSTQGEALARFQIASQRPAATSAGWTVHARGMLRRLDHASAPDRVDLGALRARFDQVLAGEEIYRLLSARGLDYGPTFRGLLELRRGSHEALGRVSLPEPASVAAGYQLHPALLDACLQTVAGALDDPERRAWMPVALGAFEMAQPPTGEIWCHVRFTQDDPASLAPVTSRPDVRAPRRQRVDLSVLDASGTRIAELSGLVVQQLSQGARRHDPMADWFLEVGWIQSSVGPSRLTPGRYLLIGDGDGLERELASALEEAGHVVLCAAFGTSTEPGLGASSIDSASLETIRAQLSDAFGGQPPTAVVHLRTAAGRATPSTSAPLNTPGDSTTPLDGQALEADLCALYDSVLHTVQALATMAYRAPPRLWLVTRGAQPVAQRIVSLDQAPLLGLGRVIAMEHPELRCARVDLDPFSHTPQLQALLAELLADGDEHEVALRGTSRHVARFRHAPPRPLQPLTQLEPVEGRPFRLEIEPPGVLDGLELRPVARRAPGPGEVEIAVEAAGLNFVDVLKALGIYPGMKDGPVVLGGECAGQVVRVGPGVEGLVAGQPVLAMAPCSFGSHVTVGARSVAPRPSALTPAQAAAIPAVFMTAWYGLVHLARLQAGERVLVHSATGGTGQAALQIARHLGAEIFATAGSPEKRAWLREQGIAHVMDSRSLHFADEVLAATRGEGVDVVLNSLSGDAIEASLSALAPDGRFIELGKTDIHADRALGLAHFKKSLSYSAVDLAGLSERRPQRFSALLHEVVALFARGVFAPLPVETFPISRASEAFRKMAQAQHLGKLVLVTDDATARLRITATAGPRIRPDASYLVTGGLGGLGLSVARWLAEKGAGHLVLIGRSGAATAAQQAAVAELAATGTRLTLVKGDVAMRTQIEPAFDAIRSSGMPLAGILHAAGLLEDGLLLHQSPNAFRRVMAPKILGALNLDALAANAPLDFFVLYASGAGLLGSPGQGNYAAASTFLDAFAHHRRARGLPALSVDWGVFSEVGLAIAHDDRAARLASRGAQSLTPAQGIEALERLLDGGSPQTAVVPLDVAQWLASYPAAASSPMFSDLHVERPTLTAHASAETLAERLARATSEERGPLLQALVRGEVSRVLRLPESSLDIGAPLTSLGLDSLMGLELRHRLSRSTTVDIPVARLLSDMTIERLSSLLVHPTSGPTAAPVERQEAEAWVDTEL
ncbi:type I polyketide synthase [Chondromyces crocatus]|uniref:Polyketide synthase n=1 Tax=Chondromyces crocatus TaxID=52 RepID=Q0VZ72_CHOCO|nr:type I polyketide synthase [Chondromyces crocatus]AKT40597.1 polyketide synthase [Chondromyces crocatus]CAJ46690.1 polyketide synthase [Chondromyces crocatus]